MNRIVPDKFSRITSTKGRSIAMVGGALVIPIPTDVAVELIENTGCEIPDRLRCFHFIIKTEARKVRSDYIEMPGKHFRLNSPLRAATEVSMNQHQGVHILRLTLEFLAGKRNIPICLLAFTLNDSVENHGAKQNCKTG